MTADDYRCHTCGNHVLYLRDHKPECAYYVDPRIEWGRVN